MRLRVAGHYNPTQQRITFQTNIFKVTDAYKNRKITEDITYIFAQQLISHIQIMADRQKPSHSATHSKVVPTEQRSCTDVICLILFLTLVVAIFIIGIYAWSAGNFKKLTTAYDPDGKGCGVDYPSYPYIYFASPHADSLWVTVCVSKCPVQTDTVLACQPNSLVKTCLPVKSTGDNTKAVEIYDTSVTANTVCLPTSDTIKNQVSSALGASSKGFSSLLKNYNLILIALPIAIIVAVLFMLIIRCMAKLFIYLLIAVSILSLVLLGVYLLATADKNTGTIIIGSICLVFALVFLIAFCCLRKRMELATIIVKVAAKFVSQNCLIVMLPIVLFVILVIYLSLWVLQALGFYSLGTPNTSQHQYPFQHFNTTDSIKLLFGFHIFHLVWVLLFFIETSNFIIGGTAVSWYYKSERPYPQASERYLKKHIGSVCAGSFMLALLGVVRMAYHILVPQKESDTTLVNIFKKCCDCVCCICTKLFECFTNGAFTLVNIQGTAFCGAGTESFKLKVANLDLSSIVAMVQSAFTFLVSIGITVTTVFVIDLLIKNVESFKNNVQEGTLILLVVALVAFTISSFFISVYSDAIDAIFMTYLYDMSTGAKNECPVELQEFIEESKK